MQNKEQMAFFPVFLGALGIGFAFMRAGIPTSLAGIICGIVSMRMSLKREQEEKEKNGDKKWIYLLGYCSSILCLESGIGSIIALVLPVWD